MTGPYAFFIAASYGVSALCLGALTLWALVQHQRRARHLRALKEALDRETQEANA
ncbi:MAG: heme exporter protein CcmD [Candidatus Puniceispirillum sp.]|nr:heme exporter protein CcmD [Candidatus Puniceispirillum sp.]